MLIANAPEELVFIAAVEWRLADHHFVEQHAKRPPIDALIILEALDDLYCLDRIYYIIFDSKKRVR